MIFQNEPRYVSLPSRHFTLKEQPGSRYELISEADLVEMMRKPYEMPKDDAPCYIASSYHEDDARKHIAQRERGEFWAILLDCDDGNHDPATLQALVSKTLGGCRVHTHDTASSRKGARRSRIVVPLDRPVPGGWITAVISATIAAVHVESGETITLDTCTKREGQHAVAPTRTGQPYQACIGSGPYCDLAALSRLMEEATKRKALYDEYLKDFGTSNYAGASGDGGWINAFNVWANPDKIMEDAGFTRVSRDSYNHHTQSGRGGSTLIRENEDGTFGFVTMSGTLLASGLGKPGPSGGAAGDMFNVYRWGLGLPNSGEGSRAALHHWQYGIDPNSPVPFYRSIEAFRQRGRELWEGVKRIAGVDKDRLLEKVAVSQILSQAKESGDTDLFELNFATGDEEIPVQEYYIDPWVPKNKVIGVYGRGEGGKSTWISTVCAQISNQASTLWITSEEESAHVTQRYLKSGGEQGTITAQTYHVKMKGTKTLATFDTYTMLEPMIKQARAQCRPDRPLGAVVLDAVVTLTQFQKGENPNDDMTVKRLLAELVSIADRLGVTIFVIGHMNKSLTGRFREDMVTGSAAWTNSVRNSYLVHKDHDADGDYESIIESVKANNGTRFASRFNTVPVITLHSRNDGPNDVLCRADFLMDRPVWGNKAINELINENKPDDGKTKKKGPTKKEQRQQAVLDAINAGGCTTRDEIIAHIAENGGGTLHGYHFTNGLDEYLQHNCGVTITKDVHGKLIYKG